MRRWLHCLMLVTVPLAFEATADTAAIAPSRDNICDWIRIAETGPTDTSTLSYQSDSVTVRFRPSVADWRLAMVDIRDAADRPLMLIRVVPDCRPFEARRLHRGDDGLVDRIEVLAPDIATVVSVEPQNPPLPRLPAGDGMALLAHVDTGVNYLLPTLQPHLARDQHGRPVGYDFWDDDDRPFDVDPRGNPYFPQHHGTTVFSVLAREAPNIGIAIYRFPATDMCRFGDLITHMAHREVRIVSLSMGSNDISDWTCFEAAAKTNPQMLFIVSAGNDGRDLDRVPIFPAALSLVNMVVVTSSDEFGRLGAGSNIGAATVDLMVPAERVEVIDHRGARAVTGGTSYAAPRVAALAARFLRANPDADTPTIIRFLESRAIDGPDPSLAQGWIPDPTDNFGF